MAHEYMKNLNLAGVKKILEDYEQMMYYYTLMRTKNKMKDSKAKSEECWEVVEDLYKQYPTLHPTINLHLFPPLLMP